jgi:glycerol-3-phosphate acyltransferase PlsX
MDEAPAAAVRQKRDSSILMGMELLKRGEVSGFVSAGNSGAVVAAAFFLLGTTEGVERPALGTIFPLPSGPVLFLDVGANADCKPSHLVQFAYLGRSYMEKIIGIPNPRVALVSNGEEEGKGNQLVRETYSLLKNTPLNFVGNVEGKDLTKGITDVVVTDGFTGNIIVKVSEGVSEMLFDALKQASSNGPHLWLATSVLRPALQPLAKLLDYTEYGGAPLLGVKGNVIIAHGRSDAKAIKSALRTAHQVARRGLPSEAVPKAT